MNYLSVCSGVEAATVAWHSLGFNPIGFSEIEPFPSAVLAHHYPEVKNFGDMTKYKEWDFGTNRLDLLVGGTPCQSFSVAGLRKGLEDPRGNLALVYCGILDRFKPKWFIWENVPGVLSSNGGRDFGSFLGAVAQLGYGFAYRVLDAQYFGVAQRRRRVFVVGCLGDWISPAKVLFESGCLSRDTPPSREKRESTARTSIPCFDRQSNSQYGESGIGSTVNARDYKQFTDLVGVYENHPSDSRVQDMGDVCTTVTRRWGTGGGNVPFAVQGVYSIREDAKANNFSATPLEVTPALQALRPSVQSHHAQTFIAQSFGWQNSSHQSMSLDNITPTLDKSKTPAVISIQDTSGRDKAQNGKGWNKDVAYTVDTHATQGVGYTMGVRRLTPVETERLQGFPDVTNSVIINVWNQENQKSYANAEEKNLKSLKPVGNAEKKEQTETVLCAENTSHLSFQPTSKPVVLNVQYNLEQKNLQILSQEKLVYSANIADKQSLCHPPIEIEDFVRLLVGINTILGKEIRSGKVALPQSIKPFTHHQNGSKLVDLYGQNIKELATDVEKFTTKLTECLKSITLEAGSNFQSSDTAFSTLCCFVTSAISSFIPEQILLDNTYSIKISIVAGYTNIPWRGKEEAPDSSRYKAMGNSMAVPVMNWIGNRIKMVDNNEL